MAEAKPCQYVNRVPVFSKSIGGIPIDPSEFVNEKGTHIMDEEERCKLAAITGDKYCPRHKAIIGQKRLAAMTPANRRIYDLARKAVNAMGFASQMAAQNAENSQCRYEAQADAAMHELFELLAPEI